MPDGRTNRRNQRIVLRVSVIAAADEICLISVVKTVLRPIGLVQVAGSTVAITVLLECQ